MGKPNREFEPEEGDDDFLMPWEKEKPFGASLFRQAPMFNQDPFPPVHTYHNGCNHWRQPVRVGRFTITCSSQNARDIRVPPTPDFGVYLATGWREKLGRFWTNGSYLKKLAVNRPYPVLMTEWPDGGVIPMPDIFELVEICLSKLRQGKKLDIGCHASHGRTGAALACILSRVEHLPGSVAIKEVRDRYCRYAIETVAQEKMVIEYANLFKWGDKHGKAKSRR